MILKGGLVGLFLFGVSLSALLSDFIKASFGCCGFFRCEFNEIDFIKSELIRYLSKNMMGTRCCGLLLS